MDRGLYIHIPICRSKCYYCDFNSFPINRFSDSDLDLYVLAMEYELKHLAQLEKASDLTSVYVGGGTPPLLDTSRLVLLLEAVSKYFKLSRDSELTVELNPLDCTDNVFRGLEKAGFNRFSLGIQSFQDETLQTLGRAHSAKEAREGLCFLRERVSNLSLDLIYGISGDSPQRWRADLEEALSFEPQHLSLYSLQVEEGTPLAKQISQGLLPNVDENIQADAWEWACDRLYATEYEHYEVSNWALPARESRHNLGYWRYYPYYGVGAGAAGFLLGKRYKNIADPREYTSVMRSGGHRHEFAAADFVEELTLEQQSFERIILALRTKDGLDIDSIPGMSGAEFWRRYGRKLISYQEMGMVWRHGQVVGLTEEGMSLSNRIFLTFMP